MHLYPTRWNCFSFGRHPPVLQLCSKSCQVLAEGRVARRVCVSHRITEQSGLWRWEEDHHYHHPGTTEMLSIHVKSQILCQKTCAGFLEILCATWGGKLRALICPRAARSCWEWRHFPLERQRKVLPFFWPLGLQKLQATKENKSMETF